MTKKPELVSINKHVKTDGIREFYYHPTRGQWLPGSYDGRAFVWDSTTKFSARQRAYQMPDGTTRQVRTTRYTSGSFRKPAAAPKGRTGREYARAYQTCHRSIYWDGALFWSACNVQVSEGEWINTIQPHTGEIRDAHTEQSQRAGVPVVSIACEEGRPVALTMDGETFPWSPECAEVLQLRAPEQPEPEPEQAAEPEQEPEQAAEQAAAEAVDAWLIALTTPGEQITLDLWASYSGAIAANAA